MDAGIDFGIVRPLQVRRRSIDNVLGTSWPAGARIKTDCNCVTASHHENSVSNPLVIQVQPCEGYWGEVRKRVWIESADGNCLFSIPVRYYVPRDIEAQTEQLHFGVVDPEVSGVAVLTGYLVNYGPTAITVWDSQSNSNSFYTELDGQTVEAGGVLEYRVFGDFTGLRRGLHVAKLMFICDSPQQENVTVPVMAEIAHGIETVQGSMDFGVVPSGSHASGGLLLTARGGSKVTLVEASNESVVVNHIDRSLSGIRVQLSVSPQLPLGRFQGMLNISVDDGLPRTVRLPYTGFITERKEKSGNLTATSMSDKPLLGDP